MIRYQPDNLTVLRVAEEERALHSRTVPDTVLRCAKSRLMRQKEYVYVNGAWQRGGLLFVAGHNQVMSMEKERHDVSRSPRK